MGVSSQGMKKQGGGVSGSRKKDRKKDWTVCPDCESRIKKRNFSRHMINVHGQQPEDDLGYMDKEESHDPDGADDIGRVDDREPTGPSQRWISIEALFVFIAVFAIVFIVYFFIIPQDGGDGDDGGLTWEGGDDDILEEEGQLTEFKQDILSLSSADANPTTLQVPDQPTEYEPYELKAPVFEMTTLDDQKVSLRDLGGKVVVLDLMATWCGPCILEMDHLQDVYSFYGDDTIEIISIDIDTKETKEQLAQFRMEYGGKDPWMFTLDKDSFIGSHIQSPAIPTIVVIDKEGYISYTQRGVTDSETLKGQIDRLV